MDKNYKFSYIIKVIFFSYLILELIKNGHIDEKIVFVILLNAAISIIKERFSSSAYINVFQFICVTFGAFIDSNFIILYIINVFDFVYELKYLGIVPVVVAVIYFSKYNNYSIYVYLIICGFFAYVLKQKEQKEKIYKNTFDNERKLRYELESAKAQLLNSSREAVYIAEIKERNRIARDIHDNIGHSIAGILMKLQVAYKLYGKDDDKAKEALKSCIEGLSNSLTVLRDTVHNIKPKDNLGIEYITKVIDNFKFCTVELSHSGNFNMLSPDLLEIVTTNIKEALTNAAKYSNASKINIDIDINNKYLRLYIKDNGTGCIKIKEGLGLSGMRDRVKNAGGSISINGENGFLIVCVIPVNKK